MREFSTSKNLLLALGVMLILAIAYFVVVPRFQPPKNKASQNLPQPHTVTEKRTITIGPSNSQFAVGVANTEASRRQGLSGRAELNQMHGMLFVFDQPTNGCVWMKEMKFNIDILWFDESMKLVTIKRDATPDSYPENFCSPSSAKYVLEIVAGSVDRLGLNPGDLMTQL